MRQENINNYVLMNTQKFKPEHLAMIRTMLQNVPDSSYAAIASIELKNPTISLILSLFLGNLGIDRFYIGSIGMGILKLFTFGCLGILTVIDWFRIIGLSKEHNFKIVSNAIASMPTEQPSIEVVE